MGCFLGQPHILRPLFSPGALLIMSLLSHILATTVSFELLLGGQARVLFSPTPSISRHALAKADRTLAAFYLDPLDVVAFTRVIENVIRIASIGVAVLPTRVTGSVFSGCLSLMRI